MGKTRRLLKDFGVTGMDFEGEVANWKSAVEQRSGEAENFKISSPMKNVTERWHERNTRWFEVTQRVFQSQNELPVRCVEATERVF